MAGLGLGGGGASHVAPSETTGLVGTSWYIAPEILGGWASYDAKVRAAQGGLWRGGGFFVL